MSQTFTPAELARFDGKDGRSAYVAVDGVVYDLSASAAWSGGEHTLCDLGARAGRDLSDEIKFAPSFMRSMLAAMPTVGTVAPATQQGRHVVQTGLLALAAVLVAVPFIAVGLVGFRGNPVAFTVLRLAALEAFTLLFIDIMMGALRPLLTRMVGARLLHRAHESIALLAFALAISHGTLMLLQGISGYLRGAVWVGPSVLALLTVVIVTALARRRLSRVWRWVHRINYLLFAAILVHASNLGYNVRTQSFVKIIFFVYAAGVVAGLAYRIYLLVGGRLRMTPERPKPR